jgi:hypothetical protein
MLKHKSGSSRKDTGCNATQFFKEFFGYWNSYLYDRFSDVGKSFLLRTWIEVALVQMIEKKNTIHVR